MGSCHHESKNFNIHDYAGPQHELLQNRLAGEGQDLASQLDKTEETKGRSQSILIKILGSEKLSHNLGTLLYPFLFDADLERLSQMNKEHSHSISKYWQQVL